MDDSALIVVRRPSGGYRDGLRSYWIEVDGVRAGKVRRGAVLELPVAPGPHDVRAKIDLHGSETVRVHAVGGQPAHLTVEPGGSALQPWHIFKHTGYLKLTLV